LRNPADLPEQADPADGFCFTMKDVQNSRDRRRIPIQKVGVKGLRYPIRLLDRRNKSQDTIAIVDMSVDLPHNFKGTHMSRFIEVLNMHHGRISPRHMKDILLAIKKKLACDSAHLEIRFPYFMEKKAPVSGASSLVSYDCAMLASLKKSGRSDKLDLIIEAGVPVTMLCPCSKEISKHGAHNQRSIITIKVRSRKLVWLEELIDIAEKSASSPVYSLLKREDEKAVTEMAYENPKFAEDAVRSVAVLLRKDSRIIWYQVESDNQESIHNHNAYAMVEGTV